MPAHPYHFTRNARGFLTCRVELQNICITTPSFSSGPLSKTLQPQVPATALAPLTPRAVYFQLDKLHRVDAQLAVHTHTAIASKHSSVSTQGIRQFVSSRCQELWLFECIVFYFNRAALPLAAKSCPQTFNSRLSYC